MCYQQRIVWIWSPICKLTVIVVNAGLKLNSLPRLFRYHMIVYLLSTRGSQSCKHCFLYWQEEAKSRQWRSTGGKEPLCWILDSIRNNPGKIWNYWSEVKSVGSEM